MFEVSQSQLNLFDQKTRLDEGHKLIILNKKMRKKITGKGCKKLYNSKYGEKKIFAIFHSKKISSHFF